MKLFTLLYLILFLQGCYYWSGSMNDPRNSNYQNPDISDYRIESSDYSGYVGYTDESLEKFIDTIEKEYLTDLKKKILDENIILPPITLYKFTDIALIEKYKDIEFSNPNFRTYTKRNDQRHTKLIAKILQRMNLFKNVYVSLNNDFSDNIIVKPSIGVYSKRVVSLGPVTIIPFCLTFGIISPLSYNEIVTIEFQFLADQSSLFTAEGVGGGYAYVSSIWMEDNPAIYDGAQNRAFGRAMHELILNIINQRENLIKVGNNESSLVGSCTSDH